MKNIIDENISLPCYFYLLLIPSSLCAGASVTSGELLRTPAAMQADLQFCKHMAAKSAF